MMSKPQLKIDVSGERELVVTRNFNAPRELVFDAWMKPELLKKWLLGPPGWEMTICVVEERQGGKYRYEWRHADGRTMAMGGVFKDIMRPERFVMTEQFDDPWYPGECVITHTFTMQGGQTLYKGVMQYATREARDMVARSDMERGMVASYDRLENLVLGQMKS